MFECGVDHRVANEREPRGGWSAGGFARSCVAKLVVKDDRFEVGVWFKRRYERLVVPFDAVKDFWDTEVQRCGEE